MWKYWNCCIFGHWISSWQFEVHFEKIRGGINYSFWVKMWNEITGADQMGVVRSSEDCTATLKCLFHVRERKAITWQVTSYTPLPDWLTVTTLSKTIIFDRLKSQGMNSIPSGFDILMFFFCARIFVGSLWELGYCGICRIEAWWMGSFAKQINFIGWIWAVIGINWD